MNTKGVEKILQVQNQTTSTDLSVALAVGSVLQEGQNGYRLSSVSIQKHQCI